MANTQTNDNSNEIETVTGIGTGTTYHFDSSPCANKWDCTEIKSYKETNNINSDNLCFFKCCYPNLIAQCGEFKSYSFDLASRILSETEGLEAEVA